MVLGVLFFAVVWTTKEFSPIYTSQPWRDDPYDALVSFTLVAVPLWSVPRSFDYGCAGVRNRCRLDVRSISCVRFVRWLD
jgi:hypothetical protein